MGALELDRLTWPEVRAEALSFPAARTDDFCDALGLIGQILDRMSSPHAPVEKEPPKILGKNVTLTDLFRENERHYKKSAQRIW